MPLVHDLSAKFSPTVVGSALARLWTIDNTRLVPVIDIRGNCALCPITLEPLKDPLMLTDGSVYEREAILDWLARHETAPCTNIVLSHKTVLRLTPLHEVIHEFLSSNGLAGATPCYVRLREATMRAIEAYRETSDCNTMQESLHALSGCIADCEAGIQELQSYLVQAQDVAGRLRREMKIQAVLQLQAAVRSFYSCKFLASLSRAHDINRRSSAAYIQACWRLAHRRRRRHILNKQLCKAVSSGHTGLVARFLASAAANNHVVDLMSPLCSAAANGHSDVVRVLCASGAHRPKSRQDGGTALHSRAANESLSERMRVPSGAGADMDKSQLDGMTPLLVAARNGHLEVVQFLFKIVPDIANARQDGAEWLKQEIEFQAVLRLQAAMRSFNSCAFLASLSRAHDINRGRSAAYIQACWRLAHRRRRRHILCKQLCKAASSGHAELVARFLASATANNYLIDLVSPLCTAAANGYDDVVRVLCKSWAQSSESRQDGTTLQSRVAYESLSEEMCVLSKAGADMDKSQPDGTTPLFMAARNGHLRIVQLLFELGADINKARHDGATPLFIAAAKGHLEVVQFLCKAGAENDKGKKSGVTPLFRAAQNGHLKVVRFLSEAGAETDKARHDEATPLLVAAQDGHLEVVQFLSDAGAEKDKPYQDGTTPLFRAAQAGHLEVVQFLSEAGADKDKPDQDGTTPLFIAAHDGRLEVVKYLLEARADKNKEDCVGTTPLFIAARNSHFEVAQQLLEARADADKAHKNGSTPFCVAAQQGHLELMQLLSDAGADTNMARQDGASPLFLAALSRALGRRSAREARNRGLPGGETPAK